jgi:hypothetical protein
MAKVLDVDILVLLVLRLYFHGLPSFTQLGLCTGFNRIGDWRVFRQTA